MERLFDLFTISTFQCRELVLHQSAKPVPLISIPNKEKEYKTQFESLETDNPCELLAATLAKADNYTLSLDKLCMVSYFQPSHIFLFSCEKV